MRSPALQQRRTSRTTIWICATLAGGVLWTTGLLAARLYPYWLAKYHGRGAYLAGAVLIRAPLRGAMLEEACLRGADLRGADLADTYLGGADLSDADLRGTDLRAALCEFAEGDGKELVNTIASFTGARYDRHTRWPEEFDPRKHGAVLVK